ncbi:hypothetical protein LWI29_002325 [Acer saccharum]|uniref:CCHC-type domain-containing protein n=1 Tax=Acer saccharum TaxID=4024 RepID=A0AA39SC26_ACESA|nr:hypothetical protein LWI29_002325 [Acer saccharum]
MNRGGSNVVGQSNAGASDVVVTLERFKKLGPPVFKGRIDPIATEAWLKQIEKVFIAIACPDKQKVVFTSFMLEDEADHWWDATSRILKTTLPINNHITWETFKNAFNEKYFPDRVRFKMERDFLNLKQDISLLPNIRSKVEVLKLTRYADVVDQALIVERSLEECKKTHEVFKRNNQQGGFRNKNAFRHGTQFKKYNNGGNKDNEKSVGDTSFKKNFPLCQRCGRSHSGECYINTGACFGCGKSDHKIKDCPKRRSSSVISSINEAQQKKPKTQGRVFAITEQDAHASNDVVSVQKSDLQLVRIGDDVRKGAKPDFKLDESDVLWYGKRLCVPDDGEMKKEILNEAHNTAYSVHPGSTKMYHDLKRNFWWKNMKKEVAEFVSRCLTCQQVKIEHQ